MNFVDVRKEYIKILGKKPFGGWKEDMLIRKIEEYKASQLSAAQGGDELSVREQKPVTPPEEGIGQVFNTILDHLYQVLSDGRYRRVLLDIREQKITDVARCTYELDKLCSIVAEGEKKKEIIEQINFLNKKYG